MLKKEEDSDDGTKGRAWSLSDDNEDEEEEGEEEDDDDPDQRCAASGGLEGKKDDDAGEGEAQRLKCCLCNASANDQDLLSQGIWGCSGEAGNTLHWLPGQWH